MKLHVDSGGRRLDIDAPPGRHLSESLAEAGIRLDLRCGGCLKGSATEALFQRMSILSSL